MNSLADVLDGLMATLQGEWCTYPYGNGGWRVTFTDDEGTREYFVKERDLTERSVYDLRDDVYAALRPLTAIERVWGRGVGR